MKKHILPILFAAMSLGLAACNGAGQTSSEDVSSSETSSGGSSSSESKTVASIALSGTYQTEYILNEGYNPDGLIVTATYSDQTSAVIDEDVYEVSGFDSTTLGEKTVTITYEGKTASYTVNINPEPTYTVTINVTVDGIDTYDDFHSKIYMNSDALGSATEWGTQVLTQDTSDVNKWSITIEDLKAGVYDYNFYYGNNEGPIWADYAKNILPEGDHRSFTVEEDRSLNVDAEFDVPDFIYKDITLTLTPSVVTSYGADPVGLNDGVQLWMWDNVDGAEVRLENQGDGTWTKVLHVPLNASTKEGQIKYTATLSNSSESAQWDYQQGDYSGSGNTWESWHDITIDVTDESETVQVGSPIFNGQPEVGYKVTYTVTLTNSDSTISYVGLKTRVGTDDYAWRTNLIQDGTVFSATYDSGSVNEYDFFFESWGSGLGGNAQFVKSKYVPDVSAWSGFHIVIDDISTVATVNISVDGVTGAIDYVAIVESTTSCVVE